MIQELLGSPVVYHFYDMRVLVREASPPPPHDTQLPFEILFITTIYTCLLKEVVYHGGTVSYKKKLKSLYTLSKKCPDGLKNLDYWYLLCKYSSDT